MLQICQELQTRISITDRYNVMKGSAENDADSFGYTSQSGLAPSCMDQQGCRRLRNAEGEQLWHQFEREVQGQQMRVQGDEQEQPE